MPIPESQLTTWARPGATQAATEIYERIRRVLENDATLSGHSFEIFLQGSYRNTTNIHGESDVDVVAMLTETYKPDYSELVSTDPQRFVDGPAAYQLTDFRRDVSAAIRRAFPLHQVTEGGKSIKIPRTSNNIPADVVPCLLYRRYKPNYGLFSTNAGPTSGIWLWDTQQQNGVISFPKQHYDNGVARQAATGNWYKPLVRVFKNARCRLEDRSEMPEGTASSFQIESLLYNVPSNLFGTSYHDSFVSILVWLNKADLSHFTCQNGIQPLFGDGRWNTDKARAYLNALTKMYLEWEERNALLRIG